MTKQPREHLIDVARRLFHQYGFHATGIDRILAESGVAKNTLYRHFKSKDELILASLRKQDEEFRNWLMREIERRDSPVEQLLAVFDVYEQWSKSSEFFGCMFINASAEFSDPDSPIHSSCAEHKRLVTRYIRELAESAGIADPDGLAAQWMLLLDGATTSVQVTGNTLAFQHAKEVARNLCNCSTTPV